MKIEGFRALGSDIIETIVNKAEKIKKLKKKGNPNAKQKKELSDEEKEYKSRRREIQEKLMKFATRIPIFMYLTDYREEALTDIIRMNDAILKFRRYEDSSLVYTGINKHESDEYVGAWSGKVQK